MSGAYLGNPHDHPDAALAASPAPEPTAEERPRLRLVTEIPERSIDWSRFTPGCAPYDHPLTCRCPLLAASPDTDEPEPPRA